MFYSQLRSCSDITSWSLQQFYTFSESKKMMKSLARSWQRKWMGYMNVFCTSKLGELCTVRAWGTIGPIREGVYTFPASTINHACTLQCSSCIPHHHAGYAKGTFLKWRSLDSLCYIQHCMDLQLAVDPYKRPVLFESMDWLSKIHRVSWHISANQISTKHSPTAVVWYEESWLQFLQKSDTW